METLGFHDFFENAHSHFSPITYSLARAVSNACERIQGQSHRLSSDERRGRVWWLSGKDLPEADL